MVELLGTLASVLILISFFNKGEKAIRLGNTVGSALFAVYGILIGSFSVTLLNGMSIIINAIKVIKLNKEELQNEVSNENK